MHSPLSKMISNVVGTDGHVIWDWNGTVLNDVDHAVSTMNHLLKDHGLGSLEKGRYREIFEFPVLNYYTALGFDFTKESFEDLCHKFVGRFMGGFRELPLVGGIEEILKNLNQQGIRQSVLSATDQENLDSMISYYGLQDMFSAVYGINDKMASSKIDRGHELMQAAAIEPTKTVIVGDTLHDLDVAEELGIQVILVGHGHQCAKILRRHCEHVVEAI